jgi:hypothetical protein
MGTRAISARKKATECNSAARLVHLPRANDTVPFCKNRRACRKLEFRHVHLFQIMCERIFVVARTFGEAAALPLCVGVLVGSVGKNSGTMRAWITCSKPEANLISVGSLKAVPVKVIPTGRPNEFPIGTLIAG